MSQDSLGVHIYQESESMPPRQALRTTVANFGARFAVTLSFVALVLGFSMRTAIVASVAWGFGLLAGSSCLLARRRRVSVSSEIGKHGLLALAVIAISQAVGTSIA